jgi:hypothetical protein
VLVEHGPLGRCAQDAEVLGLGGAQRQRVDAGDGGDS